MNINDLLNIRSNPKQFDNLKIIENKIIFSDKDIYILSIKYIHKNNNDKNNNNYIPRYNITYCMDNSHPTTGPGTKFGDEFIKTGYKSKDFILGIEEYNIGKEYKNNDNKNNDDNKRLVSSYYIKRSKSLDEIYAILEILSNNKNPSYYSAEKLMIGLDAEEQDVLRRFDKIKNKNININLQLIAKFNKVFDKKIDELSYIYDKDKIKNIKDRIRLYYDDKTKKIYCLLDYHNKYHIMAKSNILNSIDDNIDDHYILSDEVNKIAGYAADSIIEIFPYRNKALKQINIFNKAIDYIKNGNVFSDEDMEAILKSINV